MNKYCHILGIVMLIGWLVIAINGCDDPMTGQIDRVIDADPEEDAHPEVAFPAADPKIEGPWLWMLVPTDQETAEDPTGIKEDYLATASNGYVTETQIATEGAIEGDRVGEKVWTLGALSPTSADNINEVMNATGLGAGYIDYHVAYGSIVLDSPEEQNTQMYAGSDDNHKVWLNGELVNEQLDWHWAHDYQESFPVTLQKGKNVLLVAVEDGSGRWGGYFGFESGTVYTISEAGPKKIKGPWLWMLVPTDQETAEDPTGIKEDYLATASNGSVTETQIATEGAIEGDRVGEKVWTLGALSPTSADNINEVMNATGLGAGYIDYHIAYGSIVLDSPEEQNTQMYAGSDDNHKVWLNGELVNEQLDWHWAHDYQESFPVTLQKGKNVLLVAVEDGSGRWGGYFGFESETVYTILTPPRREDVN